MKEINCKVDFLELITWDDILGEIMKLERGSIILWLFDRVMAGILENGNLQWSDEFPENFHTGLIAELRAFNDKQELKVWRSVKGLKARSVKDGEGEARYIKDAELLLWGTKANVSKGFTTLTENRGTQVVIPGDFSIKDGENKRVSSKVRHYVGFEGADEALAGYQDYRFVGLKIVEVN